MSSLTITEIQQLSKEYSPLKSERSLLDILYNINSAAYYTLNKTSVRDFITTTLYRNYPNEASLKSAFIDKKLARLGTSISIFEFPIGNSRVDLCSINGSSHAYEIKTDLDNFKRLDKQLSDYMRVFEYTYVICSNNKLHETTQTISPDVGIIYYYHKNCNYFFHTYRKPQKSSSISPYVQLNALSTRELRNIKNNHHFDETADFEILVDRLGAQQINKEFKNAIKNRYQYQWFFLKKYKDEISNIDYQFFFKNCIEPSNVYQ